MNLPVRPRWIVLAVIAVLIAGGIIFRSPSNGSVNPIEAATPNYMSTGDMEVILLQDGPTDMVGCLQNCWFADPSDSKVVVFRDKTSEEGSVHLSVLGQHGSTWYRTHEGTMGLRDPDQDEGLFDFSMQPLSEGHSWMYRWGIVQDYVIAVGRASPENVDRVELVHNTGEVTSSGLTGGYFVSFSPAQRVCEARVLNYRGEVVDTFEVGEHPGAGQVGPDRRMIPCE